MPKSFLMYLTGDDAAYPNQYFSLAVLIVAADRSLLCVRLAFFPRISGFFFDYSNFPVHNITLKLIQL